MLGVRYKSLSKSLKLPLALTEDQEVSISSTFYKQLLRLQIPKVQKDSQVISLYLSGSLYTKAAYRMLKKLTPRISLTKSVFWQVQHLRQVLSSLADSVHASHHPGVNFTNGLHTAFTLVHPESVKNTGKCSVSFYALEYCSCKSCV